MSPYLIILIIGIGFNLLASLLTVFVYSFTLTSSQIAVLTERTMKATTHRKKFNTRWIYLVPFSMGFYILFNLAKNMYWLHNLKKEDQ